MLLLVAFVALGAVIYRLFTTRRGKGLGSGRARSDRVRSSAQLNRRSLARLGLGLEELPRR